MATIGRGSRESVAHRTRCSSIVASTLAVVVLLTSGRVFAGTCGDDVAGERVACRCGDVVVSDTRLRADDPVVTETCEGNGLLLRALPGRRSIRLDLAGLGLRGSGHGVGIRVLDGGSDGAAIVGGTGTTRSTVTGFRNGLRAYGRTSVAAIGNVDFDANGRDGIRLWGATTRLEGVGANDNGGDGVRAGGRALVLDDVDAHRNGRDGVHVTGRDPRLVDVRTAGNARTQARVPRARDAR
jgi:hypothetical protein